MMGSLLTVTYSARLRSRSTGSDENKRSGCRVSGIMSGPGALGLLRSFASSRGMHRLRDGACGADAEQRRQPGDHAGGETFVSREIIAEDRAYAQKSAGKCIRRAAAANSTIASNTLEFLRKRIRNLDRMAGFIATADVTHPAGDGERKHVDAPARAQVFANGGKQPLREFLRAIHRDLLCTMRQRRIGEPRDQRLLVGSDVDARRNVQGRNDLVRHHATHERREIGLCGDLIDVFVSGEKSEIRERRMAAVEKPQ